MELKHIHSTLHAESLRATNRTIMELKLGSYLTQPLLGGWLLIAPLWN